jgi:hypothetical protein
MDPMLTALLLFATITGVLMSGYYALVAKAPADRRLEAMTGPIARTVEAPVVRRGLIKRLLMSLAPYGFGTTDQTVADTLSYAGLRAPNTLMLFVGARTLISVAPALLILTAGLSAGKPLRVVLLQAGAMWLVLHVLGTQQL